jgi:hypothetical protein
VRDQPSFAAGQEIFEGRLYRRILPFETHYVDGKATHEVFRWRLGKDPVGEISAALADYVDVRDYATNHPAPPQIRPYFGVCELDIETARHRAGVRVYYQPTSQTHGVAHVVIKNCQWVEVMVALAALSKTVHPPTTR